MRRPWIASEIIACKFNPTYVIYVRHDSTKLPLSCFIPFLYKETIHKPGSDRAVLGSDASTNSQEEQL